MMKRLTPLAFALLVLGGLLTGALAGTSPAAEENASEASDPLKTEGESAEPGSDVFMTLPEVFVYAQKMQQDIRKVPTSIVNYSAQEIAGRCLLPHARPFRTEGQQAFGRDDPQHAGHHFRQLGLCQPFRGHVRGRRLCERRL